MIRHKYDSSWVCSFVLAVCVSTASLSAVLADDVSGERDNSQATNAAITSTRHVSDASLLPSHAVDEASARVTAPLTCKGTMTATQNGNWNDKNTWDGVNYPNNLGGIDSLPDQCAVVGTGITVFVDADVEVDDLKLSSAATVKVTNKGGGNLTIESPGGILSKGEIQVAHDRLIQVPGTGVTIDESGSYVADPTAVHIVAAQLLADRMTMLATNLGEPNQLTLTHTMGVTTDGYFKMDSTGLNLCPAYGEYCSPPGKGAAAPARGGKTPPILRGSSTHRAAAADLNKRIGRFWPEASLTVNGSFRMVEAADIRLSCEDMTVSLYGNFENESIYPSFFHWQAGRLYIVGETEQLFEVGGLDFGADTEGFNTTVLTPHEKRPHTNFSMGTIDVAKNAIVTFGNTFENTNAAGPCEEALYVDQLYLMPGGTINIDNVRVYAATFVGDRANVNVVADTCTGLPAGLYTVGRPIIADRCPAIPTVSEWGLIAMATLLVAAGVFVVLRRRPAQV